MKPIQSNEDEANPIWPTQVTDAFMKFFSCDCQPQSTFIHSTQIQAPSQQPTIEPSAKLGSRYIQAHQVSKALTSSTNGKENNKEPLPLSTVATPIIEIEKSNEAIHEESDQGADQPRAKSRVNCCGLLSRKRSQENK